MLTADELVELVGSLDWADALSDDPSRASLSFRRKQDDAQFPIKLELGYRDGELLLPPPRDVRSLVSVVALPAAAGVAVSVLASRFGAPRALVAGGAWYWWQGRIPATPSDRLTLYGNVDIREARLAFNGSAHITAVTVREGERVARHGCG